MVTLPKKRFFWYIVIFLPIPTILLTLMTFTSSSRAAANDIAPTNQNIHYVGRWDTSSNATYTSYWPGAYFTTRFTGTRVAIKLSAPVQFYASIDGGAETFYKGNSGSVNLTPKPLARGVHSLQVAAYSESDEIAFQGLILDAGATTIASPQSSQLIEFIGDSITAGTTASKHALSDYAWLIGERLQVRHTQIAQPGICLVNNVSFGSYNAVGMSQQFFKMQTVYDSKQSDWDFTGYQANVVVINLGANDADHNVPDAEFQIYYTTFLQNVRASYPHAMILALGPFDERKAAATQVAVQTVNAAGDNNVRYIDTTGWVSASDTNDGVHPSDAGHVKIANLLGPIIAPLVGEQWTNISNG